MTRPALFSAARLRQWFDGLSLRARITAGFAALIVLALFADGVSFLSHRRVDAAVATFIDRDDRIAELTRDARASLLRARRSEKDFLLRVREYGYEEARSRYVTLLQLELGRVREGMAALQALAEQAEVRQQTLAIDAASRAYEAGFLHVVELHGRLGRRDAGLEGRFRARAHELEALLQASGTPESLRSDLLALRRAEKDFLLRGMSIDARAFERGAAQLRHELQAAALPAPRRQQLLHLADDYRALFAEYVAVSDAIDTATDNYLSAVHTVEPLLDRLYGQAIRAAEATRWTLARIGQATQWTVALTGAVALLLGLSVVSFVRRNIDRALRACMAFAGRLAEGDLGARLYLAGGTEFGALSASLNRMADALEKAGAGQAQQAEELQRLNRALRMLSQCNEALVRAGNEAELVQLICRHAVEIGGYRLAWVGEALHDPARTLRPVAHAGIDQDYVDSLQLSWGEDTRRHGIGGAAVRERRAMVVRHIGADSELQPWHEAARARGLASCIALPLQAKGRVLGVLCIYAGQIDAFDPQEIKVLQELADDLAFGIASLRETQERQRFERELAHRAAYDLLTGLPNRFTLEARLQQAVADARRHGTRLALLVVDLDRFKMVNDTLGHVAGDRLLSAAAHLLSGAVRASDTVARLGADEFVVLLQDLNKAADAATVGQHILAALGAPLQLDGCEIRPSASIGVSLFPDDGADVGQLLRHADTAMAHAKSLGGGQLRFFTPEMNVRVAARFAMEADLRRALERGELLLHYQPQASLRTGAVTGAEALVRWRHPVQGMVSPAQFIPLAEETGLIEALGEWVLGEVCRQLRAWLDEGLAVPPVAVNLSARQFRQANLVELVEQALRRHRLQPRLLGLEITESAAMHDVESAIATAQALKALGVELSLDDFGTGYSSLSHLKRFPIDHLKIDRSFVEDITQDPDHAVICNAVIGLAHSLGLSVVAEGVETAEQMEYLKAQDCDEIQGYFFSRPLPADGFARVLGCSGIERDMAQGVAAQPE